jgi:hypothetical protein
MRTLGQIGFEAYNASTGGKTFDGRDIPPWESVAAEKPHVAKAWEDAAQAISIAGVLSTGQPKGMTFGAALLLLRCGAKVARAGWNGKAMWIALTPGSVIDKDQARAGAAKHLAESLPDNALPAIIIGAHIDMRAADGSLVIGWLASQTDMLAEDWQVVP